jgi:histidine triad (HIT) family protein
MQNKNNKIYDKNNVFAKIIRKEIPAKIIFENENILAFEDINPQAPVHVLIIPKENVINFSHFIKTNEYNKTKIADFFKTIEKIAKEVLNLKDYQITTNNGKQSGQIIFHFHVHLKGYL